MALVASPPRLLWALSRLSPPRMPNTNQISKKIRLSVRTETMRLQSNMLSRMRYRVLWISQLWAYHDVRRKNPCWDEPIRITLSERFGWFNTSAFGCIQCGVNGWALMLQLRASGGKPIGLLVSYDLLKKNMQCIHYHNIWFTIQELR